VAIFSIINKQPEGARDHFDTQIRIKLMQEPVVPERGGMLPSLSQTSVFSNSQKNLTQIGASTQDKSQVDANYSSKLSNVEAQRIMSVLQEGQRKIALLSLIPEAVDRKVVSVLGNEIAGSIQV
jgi:hypothetical protein